MPFIKSLSIFAKKAAPAVASPKISAGNRFTLALNSLNTIFAWGSNLNGRLGNNSTTQRNTPVSIGGTKKTFCHISAGDGHSTAIDKNGRLWSWGSNSSGQLGDNSTTSRLTPVSVLGATKTFCKVDVASLNGSAIDRNGRVWMWGYNAFGQLGNNSTVQRNTPISILGNAKTFCEISLGRFFVSAIDKNGRVWGWGYNNFGSVGDNSITNRCTPVSVVGNVKTFCKINSGYYHVLAIEKNGRLWAWGLNDNGQLGDNSIISQLTPVSVLGAIKTFCKISAGANHSLAIDKNGRVWAWGQNNTGQLGDNTLISKRTPVSVGGAVKTFCDIVAAHGDNPHYFSIAIDKNGKLWAWGANVDGYLGNGKDTNKATPKKIDGTTKTFCQIGSSYRNSGAIDKNGKVWMWGTGTSGQLGNNASTNRCTPVSIAGANKTFCKIRAAGTFTNAIDKNGRVWSWGQQVDGNLGNNQTGVGSFTTPVSIRGALKTFCHITNHDNGGVFGITNSGGLWVWGTNDGRLGDGTTTHRATPVCIAGATKTFCKISAFFYSTGAIDKNGRIWMWGSNGLYQLGNGTNVDTCTPIAIAGTLKTFCEIAVGSNHTLAIDKNGRVWGWGLANSGQLGDNAANGTFVSTPVAIAGALKTFCKITAGDAHGIGIDKNGRVWGWGRGGEGQVGNNVLGFSLTPNSIAGTTKTFCHIAAGYRHTTAIDKNGQYWVWGTHVNGEQDLAGVITPNTKTPISVCSI